MISGIISVILPKEKQSEILKTCKMISGKTRRQTKVLPVFRGVSLWIVIMVSPESTNFYDNANGNRHRVLHYVMHFEYSLGTSMPNKS